MTVRKCRPEIPATHPATHPADSPSRLTQPTHPADSPSRLTQPTHPAKPLLTSTNNPTVKHLVKMRDNRSRRRAGSVIVDGWRETSQAMRSGLQPRGIYVCDSGDVSASRSDSERQVIDQAGGALVRVSEAVMQKIAYGQSARGVVAEFGEPDWQLDSIEPAPAGCILVLDRIEKPGNIGAAFRCADAAGVDAVLLTPATADRFNPNAIRSSLGAVFTVPSAGRGRVSSPAVVDRQGVQIVCGTRGIFSSALGNRLVGPGGHHRGQ